MSRKGRARELVEARELERHATVAGDREEMDERVVDPPMPQRADRMSNACAVMISDGLGRRPSPSRRRGDPRAPPSAGAASPRRDGGIAACHGRASSPSTPSSMPAHDHAVAEERDMQDSACRTPRRSWYRRGARHRAAQRSVPAPRLFLTHLPLSMGPPVTMMDGTSADAAPSSTRASFVASGQEDHGVEW